MFFAWIVKVDNVTIVSIPLEGKLMPKTMERVASRTAATAVMVGVRLNEREFVKRSKRKFHKLKDSRLEGANTADEVVEVLKLLFEAYRASIGRKNDKIARKLSSYINKHCPKY